MICHRPVRLRHVIRKHSCKRTPLLREKKNVFFFFIEKHVMLQSCLRDTFQGSSPIYRWNGKRNSIFFSHENFYEQLCTVHFFFSFFSFFTFVNNLRKYLFLYEYDVCRINLNEFHRFLKSIYFRLKGLFSQFWLASVTLFHIHELCFEDMNGCLEKLFVLFHFTRIPFHSKWASCV